MLIKKMAPNDPAKFVVPVEGYYVSNQLLIVSEHPNQLTHEISLSPDLTHARSPGIKYIIRLPYSSMANSLNEEVPRAASI